MAIHVALFEDHDHLRSALSLLIEGAQGFVLTGAYAHANDLEAVLAQTAPDVVLMDISMPGRSGIEAVRVLRQLEPQLPVVILTVFEDEEHIFEALCAGATGYLLKNTPPDRLLAAITEVLEGGAPMTPLVARKALGLFQRFQSEPEGPDYRLTPKELQVLGALVEGKSYKMIGSDLSISYETVRSHMKSIYEKLHVASMTEAVAKALREGLV